MKTTIKISNVTKVFKAPELECGTFKALDCVSTTIKNGCTVIGGANGSGKSVLMSIIARLCSATSGKVEVLDENGISSSVGLVFQDADTQILGETPLEDVMFGVKNLKLPRPQMLSIAEKALSDVGLLEKKNSPARFLSGGEKRRLSVAGILALNRNVIIFDEPYANLDFTGVKQVNSLIKKLLLSDKTIIILTHELEKCLAFAEKLVVLYKGKIVFDGAPEKALEENLESWAIKNPLSSTKSVKELLWL